MSNKYSEGYPGARYYGGNVNNTSQWSNQGKVVLYGVKS